MDREDNLNGIFSGQNYNKHLDNQMDNNFEQEKDSDGSNVPSIFTAGTTPDILNRIKGEYCVCEFVIGSDTLITKSGIMYNVGLSYFTLFNISNNEYIVCDIYSVKFITVPRTDVISQRNISSNQRRNRR